MPGPFNDPEATVGFDMGDAYRRASGNSPVKARDLKAAYRPYNDTGKALKVGGKQKKSDSQLYKLATQEVLEWYKAKKQPPKKKRASTGGGRAVRQAASQQSRTSTRRSGGSASTGRKLPDTATSRKPRVTTATRLPSITPSEGSRVNRSAPSTQNGVRIQRPAGRGFTQYGI